MHSALYIGKLRHRRTAPSPHAFSYAVYMIWLDLSELDTVFRGRWLWSTQRRALAWFRRADYLGDADLSLDEAVRRRVAQSTGRRPAGPIRMLSQLRNYGHCFNPVTFYYCYDPAGLRVESIVAEITNTPWRRATLLRIAGVGAGFTRRAHAFRFQEALSRIALHAA